MHTDSFTPKQVDSLDDRMPRSTVSKAADRSSESKITVLFLSTAVFDIFHSVQAGFKVRFVRVCLFDPVDNLSSDSKAMFILHRIAFAPARKPDRASVHVHRSVHTRRQVDLMTMICILDLLD